MGGGSTEAISCVLEFLFLLPGEAVHTVPGDFVEYGVDLTSYVIVRTPVSVGTAPVPPKAPFNAPPIVFDPLPVADIDKPYSQSTQVGVMGYAAPPPDETEANNSMSPKKTTNCHARMGMMKKARMILLGNIMP